jgi:membrane-bound metal-dependent hydrolase YbcI (DUF457 family)
VSVALTAGAAVLPDIGHPDSSIARSFGPGTRAFAWVSGGHRHGTHIIAGTAALTAAAGMALARGRSQATPAS